MDIPYSSVPWLSEMEMDDFYLPDEDELGTELMVGAFVEDLQQTIFNSESNSSYSTPPLVSKSINNDNTTTSYTSMEDHQRPPTNQLNPNNNDQTSSVLDHKTNSEPLILSFGNSDLFKNVPDHHLHYKENIAIAGFSGDLSSSSPVFNYSNINSSNANQFHEDEIIYREWSKKISGATTKPASQLRDHVLAERKRRENLNKLFIALSTVVPGLKKTDKSSVLGETIKYIKQLQEKEKKLEVQSGKKDIEQVIVVKKTKIVVDDEYENDGSDETSSDSKEEWLPQIEAKVSGNNVLLKLHCKKQKGVLAKALSEMDKYNLKVINTSAMPFGDLCLDITIIAQIEQVCCAPLIKSLVRSLHAAFEQL